MPGPDDLESFALVALRVRIPSALVLDRAEVHEGVGDLRVPVAVQPALDHQHPTQC